MQPISLSRTSWPSHFISTSGSISTANLSQERSSIIYSQSKTSKKISRRSFLYTAAGTTALSTFVPFSTANGADTAALTGPTEQQIRDYLRPLLLPREDVDLWLARKDFPFCKYDPELGYLHLDRDFEEGQDGSVCRYRYDKLDARQMSHYADQPCRINTYGNSFTSCEQVSDGETWQEVLAAHLGEPIRNYGIGGYSVYQAYLRMLREENKAPAPYLVFNIFDDDHIRNLHGWQRFKFGINRKSTCPTIPHVKVDLDAGRITDCPNPCPTNKSIYDLCDLDRVYTMFRDDAYMRYRLARAARKARGEQVSTTEYDDPELMRPAIFASTKIVQRVQEFARENNKQVLFVLSFGVYNLKQFIETGKRFDQAMVDYLHQQQLPYVDLMQAHAADAARFKGTANEALARYFIGHYNPLGNLFCAFAMKDALVKMLDPKPAAYAR